MKKVSYKLMGIGLIFAVLACICYMITIVDNKFEMNTEIYYVYLGLIFLGISAYFVQMSHIQFVKELDYYFAIFIIVVMLFATILFLILRISYQEWIFIFLVWYVISMFAFPAIYHYRRNTRK
jgi:hypothetical protein